MKELNIIGLILFLSIFSLYAQEAETINEPEKLETLFGGKSSFGGFMDFSSHIGTVNDQDAVFMGGGIYAVINRKVNVGFSGYGMVSDVHSNNTDNFGEKYNLQMGYGGIHIEPVIGSNKLVHLTLPVLLGAGGIAETEFSIWDGDIWDDEPWDDHDDHPYHINNVVRSDVFFIAQPGVNAEINIFKHLRFAAGANYRFVSDVELPKLNNVDFEGLSGNVSIRFGWF